MRFVPHADVNGQRLFYVDRGDGADVIVFSHGFLMDHSMFGSQVEALSADWRCIAWDERGHGATEDSGEEFDYWDSARDALSLIDHLGIDRVVLAGMSQGGFLSLRAAMLAPDRVRALVLMDTQSGVEDPVKIPLYDQLVTAWEQPGGPPQEALGTVSSIIIGPDEAQREPWEARWSRVSGPQLRHIYRTLMGRDDITPRLGELAMPALVIHGAADIAIEEPIARALARALPNARIEIIPGAGHAANLTHPAPVNDALRAFLDEL
jgi:pimeloyl-ACP methyl ester carboxylesterase